MEISVTGIQVDTDGTLNFGDFSTTNKQKVDGFVLENDTYSLRTYDKATRLEKNASLVLETTPGTKITNFFKETNKEEMSFIAKGFANTIITAQLASDTLYRITNGKTKLGSMKSNLSGKVKFSVDLSNGKPQQILLEKLKEAN